MNRHERNEARQRIATACLAAMLGQCNSWGDGETGPLAEIACDYADRLLDELQRREERDAT